MRGAGFDSAIRRFESSRPSHPDRVSAASTFTSWNAEKPNLLKPHTASGRRCSGHLKFPAKLPRQSLNESQARRSSQDRLQIEARAVIFDIEEQRVVFHSQPNPNNACPLSIQSILDCICKKFIRNQSE